MTGKKLSDSDKSEILNLYRQTGETTSTLAERYGVSNSTISRFLKTTLPEEEYETLIAAKRAARTPGGEVTPKPLLSSEPEPEIVVAEPLIEVQPSPETIVENVGRRRRASTTSKPKPKIPAKTNVGTSLTRVSDDTEDTLWNQTLLPLDTPGIIEDTHNQPEPLEAPTDLAANTSGLLEQDRHSEPEFLNTPTAVVDDIPHQLEQDKDAEANAIAQMLGEELLYDSEDLTDLDDDDDEDDLDEEEDDEDEYTPIVKRRIPVETLVQVLPLSVANLPKTCYLVIDRASELITRPLKDFGDLGQIPSQEIQQKTLPVFDNHRVARRFSSKRDRVIKVPDSRILQKTRSHLQAKGITRLLVDGQVYSLI